MGNVATNGAAKAAAPWHLWAVGILSLLWNASGAFTIVAAQTGNLPDIKPDEAAYYAAQPLWLVISTDIALATGMLGAIALLVRRRWAVALYATTLLLILVNSGYDLAAGTSRMLANQAAMIVTILIAVLALLQLLYARAMHGRGVLR